MQLCINFGGLRCVVDSHRPQVKAPYIVFLTAVLGSKYEPGSSNIAGTETICQKVGMTRTVTRSGLGSKPGNRLKATLSELRLLAEY